MLDPRIDRLAEILLTHSCELERGENVLIEAFDLPEPTLVCRLVEQAAKLGARPLVSIKNNAVLRSLYATGTAENIGLAGALGIVQMLYLTSAPLWSLINTGICVLVIYALVVPPRNAIAD